MRIMVVGPGAIGTLFAARLHRAGQDVVLLDHKVDRAERLASQGIQIQTEDRTEIFRVPVFCSSVTGTSAPPNAPEIVLLCVKAYDTLQAARDVVVYCDSETLIVSLQNGIGNDEQLTTVFPRGSIVCGSTGTGSTGIAEGAVREAGQGLTALAPSDGLWTSNKRAVANSLQDAGFEVDCHDDAVSLVWSKAVLNAAINPVTVLHNILNGGILERAEAHDIMRAAAREAQSVAESMGIALHYEDAVTQAERVCAQTEKNVSSMLQDYRTGRRTEIQNINGEIVRAAIAQGLPAPVNASLVERVLALSAAQ